jgi:DNA polymerase-3 subunit delta
MTPAQFLAQVKSGRVPAVCLFLGLEAYERRRCRQAAMDSHLGGPDSEGAITQYDAGETELSEILDDARALSLFAAQRVILVTGAEAALPRSSRAAASDDEGDDDAPASSPGAEGALAAYVKDPTPGTLLLFEATRFDLEGEEKKKSDRVRKFYAAIPDVVEFKRFSPDDARIQLAAMAKQRNLKIDAAASAMLVEALGADVARIAVELEKLSLYADGQQTITMDDIIELIPDARTSTVFTLVNALGRGDRARALASLDALCRDNEYLPLALAFLSTQFRQALAAKKANLRSSQQVQSYFSKMGVNMWGSRAEQVAQTAQKFSTGKLEAGLKMIFDADRDLRSARPDDRIVIEDFVIRLTA